MNPPEKGGDLRNVLHVTHSWGGGVSTYIEDLEKSLKNRFRVYKLKCWRGVIHVEYERDGLSIDIPFGLDNDIPLTEFSNTQYAKILSRVLDDLNIDLVHIDSQIGHTFDIFTVPAVRPIPIVCTVHDFFYICPTIHLVDTQGIFCGICQEGPVHRNCLENHSYLYSKFGSDDLGRFRRQFKAVIPKVDAFIFPSQSTKDIFSKYYGLEESVCKVIYHGTPLIKSETFKKVDEKERLRVGIIGTMLKHKGKKTIQTLIDSLNNVPVEFYHFGDGDLTGLNLTNLGRYDRHQIVDLIRSHRIDVTLLLSTWPETFSYTLTETIAANIPPIVSNMGALAERVAADKIGWIVDHNDLDGFRNLILLLMGQKQEIEKYKKRLLTLKLKNISEMQQEYLELYNSILSSSRYDYRNKYLFRFKRFLKICFSYLTTKFKRVFLLNFSLSSIG